MTTDDKSLSCEALAGLLHQANDAINADDHPKLLKQSVRFAIPETKRQQTISFSATTTKVTLCHITFKQAET